MSQLNGYSGRVLYVDLTSQTSDVRPLDKAVAREFIGGRGLGDRLLFDLMPPDLDPLSPDAPLIFAGGPLTGTKAPTAGRFSLTGRSPLTGTVLDTNCGGSFGMRMKAAGYDAIVVTGKAERPTTLIVDSDGARFAHADGIWGAYADTAAEVLLSKGEHRSVATIGPAGETGSLLATIMVDAKRALGRGGMGAVMGSKTLKAVVVEGEGRPSVADPEALDFFLYEVKKMISSNPVTSTALPKFGTAMLVGVMGKRGLMPADNFRTTAEELVDALSGERLAEERLERRGGCWGCPIQCGRVVKTREGKTVPGPEYETIWALGANLGISDLGDVVELNELCNRLGLDTISVGGTLGCAIELAESGGGLEARKGDVAWAEREIRRLAFGEDEHGRLLAQGSLALATEHGRPDAAMQVKGLELPAYDPRGMQGQGLGYATSNRGGCHLRGNMLGFEVLGTPKLVDRQAASGKAGLLIVAQHLGAALDSLAMCKFSSFAINEEHYARLYSAVTGWELSGQDLLLAGERIWNLERLYNLRQGFRAEDDRLPTRLLEEPNAAGEVVHLDEMLEEYYRFRGWDHEGRPTRDKLERLGLLGLAESSGLA